MTEMPLDERVLQLAAEIKATYSPAEVARLARLIEPTPSTGEMSAEVFEQLLELLQNKSGGRSYSDKSIEAARLVLVMGATKTEAANDTGVSKQTVDQLMNRIRRRMEAMPQGWVKVTQWFPAEVAKQIDGYAHSLKAAHAAGTPLSDTPRFSVSLNSVHENAN